MDSGIVQICSTKKIFCSIYFVLLYIAVKSWTYGTASKYSDLRKACTPDTCGFSFIFFSYSIAVIAVFFLFFLFALTMHHGHFTWESCGSCIDDPTLIMRVRGWHYGKEDKRSKVKFDDRHLDDVLIEVNRLEKYTTKTK